MREKDRIKDTTIDSYHKKEQNIVAITIMYTLPVIIFIHLSYYDNIVAFIII